MTKFEHVQELAAKIGVEVQQLPDRPNWCRLAMPSRISQSRRMPPLRLDTAEAILNDEIATTEAKPS
jgi:hypothetical protein